MQRGDFEAIFRAMEGYPVCIRLLDPPLHEFLPHSDAEIDGLAAQLGVPADRLRTIVHDLREVNPMLGLRGCRLGIMYPEITHMQARAIFEAACSIALRKGRVQPEIMVPLVASVVEFRKQALIVRQAAHEVFSEMQISVPFLLGTMIELPRAALTADEIAREAQFFSFGTNDLTQTTWGLSRDDAGRFLPDYIDKHIIDNDPFQVLDVPGVGQADPDGVRDGPEDAAGPQARHLRRARRRAGVGGLLRQARHELRELLAVPRADRATRRGAGGARRAGRGGPDPRDV